MIKIGFLLLTLAMAALVYLGIATTAKKTIGDTQKLKRFKATTALVLMGWLAYVTALSLASIFATTALPPRIPLLLILPCFAFMVWFFRSGRFAGIIHAMPAAWLAYAQSFRIAVELLLAGLAHQMLIPRAATFEGYNYEIVIGISAIIVGYWGKTKRIFPRSFMLLWNGAGLTTLAIVVFIFLSHAYTPQIYTDPEPLPMSTFGAFPYTLLAGFLMPLAVFMHIFSIVKIRREKHQ